MARPRSDLGRAVSFQRVENALDLMPLWQAVRIIALVCSLALVAAGELRRSAIAQEAAPTPVEAILLENSAIIQKSSRRTIEPAIAALLESDLSGAAIVLERWRDKALWARKADGRFFLAEKGDAHTYLLKHVVTGNPAGTAQKSELKQIKPNSGIRALISSALVQFQLQDQDADVRSASLDTIQRDPQPGHLAPLRSAIDTEPDPILKARKHRVERLLTIRFDDDSAARVAAIESLSGDLGVDVRAALNPLVETRLMVAQEPPGSDVNVARIVDPLSGSDLSASDAYALLIEKGLAPPTVDDATRNAALIDHIVDGAVGGVPLSDLASDEARDRAYSGLAQAGIVTPAVTEADKLRALEDHTFYAAYVTPDRIVTDAATTALDRINGRVAAYQAADLALDALSLASIYFLAAIGLAITFGVMGVINMAHGEFIMIGAYTGYVVQLFIPDYTVSILVALPLAFAVAALAGVALERLVIRWLYDRPLETLLATFGVSIALQQIAKNIFGTQARPLTSPSWLDGALVFNDIVSISYIRIAIFVLALAFFGLLLYILRRTRLGLEVRAVTQNPRMAASMGINTDRINMLTFGLGSGIAGIAGVAIGLFAKVTSELGSDYIVQSFMTVVVGGVGNVWGTLAGATMIGFVQKGIEWLNPSNTLAAQTFMIIFIIIYIQFRPRGMIPLKGRAAGD